MVGMAGAYTIQNGTAAGFKVPQEKNHYPDVVSISAHCRPLIFFPSQASSLKLQNDFKRWPQSPQGTILIMQRCRENKYREINRVQSRESA